MGVEEDLKNAVYACSLISRHSGNSVLRMDNSVLKCLNRIYSPDYYNYSQCSIQAQRSVRICCPVFVYGTRATIIIVSAQSQAVAHQISRKASARLYSD